MVIKKNFVVLGKFCAMFTLSCYKRTNKCKRHMNWCIIYWWGCFCECYWQHYQHYVDHYTLMCLFFFSDVTKSLQKNNWLWAFFAEIATRPQMSKIMTNSQKPLKWGMLCTMEGLVTVWFLHLTPFIMRTCWKDYDNSVLTTLHCRFLVRLLNLAVHDRQMDLIV